MASTRGIKAGRAYVEVGANTGPLTKGLASARKQLADYGASVAKIGAGMAAAGAAITSSVALAVKSFVTTGSRLVDLSARTGISVEHLSFLGYAAAQTGTDIEAVAIASAKLSKAIQGTTDDSGPAADVLERLGLSISAIQALSPEDQFAAIAKAIAGVADPAKRVAIAMQLFGRGGAAMLPLIMQIDALRARFEKLGLTWSKTDAEAADTLGDSLTDIGYVFKAIGNAVASVLAPTLVNLSTQFADAASRAIAFVRAHPQLVLAVTAAGVALSAAGAAITALGVGMMLAGPAIAAVGTFVAGLVSPVGLAVTGIAALGAGFLYSSAKGDDFKSKMGDIANTLRNTLGAALQFVGDLVVALTVTWRNFGTAAELAMAKAALGAIQLARAAGDVSRQIVSDFKHRALKSNLADLTQRAFPDMNVPGTTTAPTIKPTLPGEMERGLELLIAELDKTMVEATDGFHAEFTDFVKKLYDTFNTPLKPAIEKARQLPDLEPQMAAAKSIAVGTFGSERLGQFGGGVPLATQLAQKQVDLLAKIDRNIAELERRPVGNISFI